ncbi:S1C family serine protease [Dongia rigui]|uniref:Trypsin-like peptidase domain-containing protein n=1 Tax=Dongia rigui TaxID=940149 RepID=A0ABU5DZK8_9PROT|nr:trypsin-like peptidase domain-containing protein [Dongia rigui]MDY0872741.1 trypsin-like peptidase domain-containing protein [Dongia rigui]
MFGQLRQCCVAAVLLAACLSITACERTHVEAAPLLASAASQGEDLAPIQLDRVVFNLERGQQIGTYRDNNFKLCGQTMLPQPIHWAAGKVTVRDEEMMDSFYRALKSANYDVVGDPDALFGNYTDAKRSPEYLVGGRVDFIALDVCDEVTWGGRWKGTQSGLGRVDVTWQVFSPLEGKVVLETRTSGSDELNGGVPKGEVALIMRAFAVAARNLAGDPRFHDVLLRRNHVQTAAAPLNGWGEVPAQSPMALPLTPLFTTPIGTNMARIQASVVTIFSGVGQGSGFFITPELVLTNHHVAHDAKRLKVVFINGTEVYATTLRSDPKRDVALLKVEGGPYTPLPLRLSALELTEEVYAVGSPLDPSLAGTVTRGIVSQIKENEFGQPLIQADASIQHGSSGGPLLDAKGNVVGISQSALTDQGEYSVGINFFIPIADGVQRLGLQLQ